MSAGQMDFLTGTLRRLVFRPQELLETDPTMGEEERGPTSSWAYTHAHAKHGLDACHAYLSVNQVIVDTVWTTVEYDTTVFDRNAGFDGVNYEYEFKIGGLYLIFFRIGFSITGAGLLAADIRVDGNQKAVFSNYWPARVVTKNLLGEMPYNAVAGEKVKIRAMSVCDIPGNDATIYSGGLTSSFYIAGLNQ